MTTLKLKAPAKINYLLNVIRRRPDGYHDLRMIMQRINLCDEISLSLTDTSEITVTCGSQGVPNGPGNIAWKAARAMLDLSGSAQGASINIVKNIPVAAGLGGGSSDAATVLMGLNQLLDTRLSDQQLMKIGVKLGADVPFFIFKNTALAEGIGERLTAIRNMPNVWILLVNPGVHVSTGWVYKSLQLTNDSILSTLPEFFGSAKDICNIFANDLETVTIPAFPVIAEIKDLMLKSDAVGSMMSGSGSTVFGIFETQYQAELARDSFADKANWFTAVAKTI